MRDRSLIDRTVSATRLHPYLDCTDWPDTRPDDVQEESTIHLPEDCEELLHDYLGGATKIVTIFDERNTNCQKGIGKDYLAVVDGPLKKLKVKWKMKKLI